MKKNPRKLRWLIFAPAAVLALTVPAQADPLPGLNARGYNFQPSGIPLRVDDLYPSCGTEVENNINRNFDGEPFQQCGSDFFMVHYDGYITFPENTQIQMMVAADDGGTIKVAETEFGTWNIKGCSWSQVATFTLSAGSYPLDGWFFEWGGGACFMLAWKINNGYWEIVPDSAFTRTPLTPTTTTTTTSTTTTTTTSTTTTTTTLPPTTTTEATTTSTAPPTTTTVPLTTTTEQTTTTTTLPTTTTTTVYVPPATTTTTTEAPPPPTTTTTIYVPPATTTTEATTTTTSTVPETTTTLPPTTTVPETTTVAPSTTQPSSTTTVHTTVPPTTTAPETPTTQPSTTTQAPPPPIQPETTSPPQITLPNDADSSQITQLLVSLQPEQVAEVFAELQVSDLNEEQVAALVAAVQAAPTEVREAFEDQIDIFKEGLDDYVPVGSNVPVGTRRTLVAVGAAITAAGASSRMRQK